MAAVTQTERATGPCRWPTVESLEENLREARRAAAGVRRVAQDAVAEAASNITRRPLRAVGVGLVVGAVTGALVGFGAGWFARVRE